METFNRVCIEDYAVEARNGDRLELKRGQEYLTSREEDGKVVVFTNFWVPVPSTLFTGATRFTKAASDASEPTSSLWKWVRDLFSKLGDGQ